jgi:hypothetical protein
MKDLTKEHFNDVLRQAEAQVFEGKGSERHGLGKPFNEQPWVAITDNVGIAWDIGQAEKKLMELRVFSNHEAWKREALGAIAYITMAIMHEERRIEQLSNEINK